MTRVHAVIFDLDGTLLDSLEDIASAVNQTLRERSLPEHPLAAYRYFVGEGVETLVVRALPVGARDASTVADCVTRMRALYATRWAEHTRPYEGIPDLLARLARAGLRTAILTNKPDEAALAMVGRLLGSAPFAIVRGARPGVPRKPDPTVALAVAAELGLAPADCAFVGDSSVDMQTACAAGMRAVGVTWGYRDAAELREHGAEALCATPEELAAWLQADA